MRTPIVDNRPWGKFYQFTHNEKSTVKIITVEPGHKLSLQRHKKRDELWVGVGDYLIAIVDGKQIPLTTVSPVWIPRGSVHTISNMGYEPASFVEIAFGDFDENDIERLEDKYGRK